MQPQNIFSKRKRWSSKGFQALVNVASLILLVLQVEVVIIVSGLYDSQQRDLMQNSTHAQGICLPSLYPSFDSADTTVVD